MVKVIGPLGGFDASGSLAGSLVFAKWKGRNYVRRLVKPSNPNTGPQVSVRRMWKFLSQEWAGIITGSQTTWDAQAAARNYLPFNAYMSTNQFNWRNFLAPSQLTPVTRAIAVDAINTFTAVAGVRQITITISTTVMQDENWGSLLFRGLVTGFTPSVSNLVAVVPSDSANDVIFVDTPLEPDEYFYDAKAFSTDGKELALEGEISATVT